MQKRILILSVFAIAILCLLFSACTKEPANRSQENQEFRSNTPIVYTPTASGESVASEGNILLDYSNIQEGYFMVKYDGSCKKVKLQLTGPSGTVFSYFLSTNGNFDILPLSDGGGNYIINVFENISDDLYAVIFSYDFSAETIDPYKPYLYPNQYVNFDANSSCVSKAEELASACYSDLDVINSVYEYITKNIDYDVEKAQNVSTTYLPDNTVTLSTGKGICFDYAALMSAMLRSQGIPTKLEVGYVGQVYHAWISTYIEGIGMVENIIYFDGTSWTLMDPTLQANNNASDVKKYIGDGSKYTVKYTY